MAKVEKAPVQGQQDVGSNVSDPGASDSEHSSSAQEREYTIEDVEAHYTKDDFWTVIDNVVYDLSGYGDRHPGGAASIMTAAGADSTVAFNTHHFRFMDKPNKVLQSRRIGVLVGRPSPKMGEFWWEAARQVTEELKDLPLRPMAAKVWWFIDHAIMIALMAIGWFCTSETSLWILVPLNFASYIIYYRLAGQQHATFHTHVFHPKWQRLVEWVQDMIMWDMLSFKSPNRHLNERRMLNKTKPEMQFETCPFGRGVGEHYYHHVNGAELDEVDACFYIANGYETYRLTPKQRWLPWHYFQGYFLYQCFANFVTNFIFLSGVALIPLNGNDAFRYFIPRGDWYRFTEWIMMLAFKAVFFWRPYFMLYLAGWEGIYAVMAVTAVQTLWLQNIMDYTWIHHQWDAPDQKHYLESKEDWGYANIKTLWSYQSSGVWYGDPLSWGYPNEGTPSTATYHLEHSLFPSVSWVHLPRIAPILEKCAKEFGMPYCKFSSNRQMAKVRQEKMEKYAMPPQAEKKTN